MRLRAALGLIVAVLISGCGPRTPATYPVTGRVAFADGQPLRSGLVEFYSAEHKVAARGRIAPDGSYFLSTYGTGDGAVAGKHLVTVAQSVLDDHPLEQHHHHGSAPKVNPRYANPQSSGLEFTVESGDKNEFVIRLDP